MPAGIARPADSHRSHEMPRAGGGLSAGRDSQAAAKDDFLQASTARLERSPSFAVHRAAPKSGAADRLSAAAPILPSWPACMHGGEVGSLRDHKFSDLHTAAFHDLLRIPTDSNSE